MLKICAITATKGRHSCIERIIAFYLAQDYKNFVHLTYNNSSTPQKLDENLPDNFILVNNHLNLQTRRPYTNLGDIYRDALTFVPEDCEVITFSDDDDIFLPNHLSEGVKGLLKCGKTAYKPKKSFYYSRKVLSLLENTLEPSIFVKKEHVQKYGFSCETTAQHHQWLNPLVYSSDIFVDPEGKATMVYDWSQEIPAFKTSGNPLNPDNFKNYENYSKDEGDGIISPGKKPTIYAKLRSR